MMQVTVDFPVSEIRKHLGLGRSDEARVYLAKEVRRRCDKYVPYDTGALKGSAALARGGSAITYTMPYAARQFYENYRHRDPRRGDHWHQRMLRWEKQSLLRQLAHYFRGVLK